MFAPTRLRSKHSWNTSAPLITVTAITSNQRPDWPVLAKTYQISWSRYFLGSSEIVEKNLRRRLQLPAPAKKHDENLQDRSWGGFDDYFLDIVLRFEKKVKVKGWCWNRWWVPGFDSVWMTNTHCLHCGSSQLQISPQKRACTKMSKTYKYCRVHCYLTIWTRLKWTDVGNKKAATTTLLPHLYWAGLGSWKKY